MVMRERLEAQLMRTRLKSRPVKLPFEDAVGWARRMSYWKSEAEWLDWIEMGELKNPYIPSNPASYYGRRGEWRGWHYFLGVKESCSPEELVSAAADKRRTAAWRSTIWFTRYSSPEGLVKAAWRRINKPSLP